ncbi:hypothetical protein IFR04_009224 [Cadophora malorum]|uniref:Uncharacterized protein n=1 Tax=Cadophora malorum TaxID=108018 RepID=A0A8H7TD54_9HELO|nr:hypothetical protein IFR04_009224 [Cadophora malorum]
MPHASTGTQHSCPGASGPVTLRNGNVISAGNCTWTVRKGKYRWCTRHENICFPHDWTYSKKDECKHCQKAKQAARDEAERKKDEKRKRKRDDDDDERKTLGKKEDFQGNRTPAKKSDPPSARKTRSATKKEAEQKGGKQGGKKAQHWHFWMAGRKVIDLDGLVGYMVAISDESTGPCCGGHADCV